MRGVGSPPGNDGAKFNRGRDKNRRPGAACPGCRRADSEASGMGRRRAPELYRAPFPLYALQVDPSTGLLIAAGGGGAAKTGIKNGVVRTRGRRDRVTPRAEGDSGRVAGSGRTPASDPAPPGLKSPACRISRREFQPSN